MNAKPKIVFLTSKDPFHTSDWSGIPFFMYQALERHFDILVIRGPGFRSIKLVGHYFSMILQKIFKKKYLFDYGIILSLFYGVFYTLKLHGKRGVRFVFCPAGLTEISFILTSLPIVSVGDCSTLQLINYYPSLMDVFPISVQEVKWIERKAIRKVKLQIFSSGWAANFVQTKFSVPYVKTIPFGANVPEGTKQGGGVKNLTGSEKIELLFVAVDWYRKGGDIVLSVFRKLQLLNYPTRLTIVGCKPEPDERVDNVVVYDHINKDTEEGRTLFNTIWNRSHILILPTRADCTPIVIAESFSHAIPVLTNDTGGLRSMVENGTNGYVLKGNDPENYLKKIILMIDNPDVYKNLSDKSLTSYRTVFNWEEWASTFVRIVNETL
jgi:alpha-maltose-1-phosphate synthase